MVNHADVALRVATLLARAEQLSRFTICLDLTRITALLDRLHHPEKMGRFIHVAGTNGKGSTVACVEAILSRAGYGVACYTSPHLQSFHERIRIAGLPVRNERLLPALEEVMAIAEDLSPTFFEITTAAAMLVTAGAGMDWNVYEVGLGGRLDATNLIHPQLCLITPIGLDHTQWLGKEIAAIAREKAGIIKPGVPLVADPGSEEAFTVMAEQARQVGAPALFRGRDFHWEKTGEGIRFHDASGELLLPPPGLPGAHQYGNAALAVAGLRELERQGQVQIPPRAWGEGVAGYFLPGRLERIKQNPEIWLDGAHNPPAARALATTWRDMPGGNTDLLFSLLGDKEADKVAAELAPLVRRVTVTSTGGERAGNPLALARIFSSLGVETRVEESVKSALEQALSDVEPGGRLLVTGSLYLVGSVRTLILQNGTLQ